MEIKFPTNERKIYQNPLKKITNSFYFFNLKNCQMLFICLEIYVQIFIAFKLNKYLLNLFFFVEVLHFFYVENNFRIDIPDIYDYVFYRQMGWARV